MLWQLTVSPTQSKVVGLNPGWALTMWSLHLLPASLWVLSRYSSFFPQSTDIHGVGSLSHHDSWDRLQSPHDPELNKQKKTDGCYFSVRCAEHQQFQLHMSQPSTQSELFVHIFGLLLLSGTGCGLKALGRKKIRPYVLIVLEHAGTYQLVLFFCILLILVAFL